ncbi:Ubiquitin-conjugating enzyme E2 J2 [Aphanomyces cochlioides]|nr:Ubiquitin-conjugating enzyme E2 J2 [Aphanomyces cochlioides]
MDLATKRLRKEYTALKKNPVDNIEAVPLESNILEWHYVIRGVGLYEGGFYHGKLVFPRQYPMKPPSVYMITPSGRFETNVRLCLSMSDFHPETWNPLWSVGSILIGLCSFMNENTPTTGSIETSDQEKQALAKTSLAFNCQPNQIVFRKCFPHLVELHEDLLKQAAAIAETSQEAIDDDKLIQNE